VDYLEFSPNGRLLLARKGPTVWVWDSSTGRLVGSPLRCGDSVLGSAAFSPDGRRVLAHGEKNTVRLWDIVTAQPLTPPLKYDGDVALRFTPDGRTVVLPAQVSLGAQPGWDITPEKRPIADLENLVGLLTGIKHSDETGLTPLGAGKTRDAWQVLSAKYPQDFAVSSGAELIAYHRERVKDCESRKQWHAALKHYDHLVSARPDEAELFRRRGWMRTNLNEWQQAVADLRKAITLKPDAFEVWYLLALVQLHRGDEAGYRQTRANLLKQPADNPSLWLARTAILAPGAVTDFTPLIHLAQKSSKEDVSRVAKLKQLQEASEITKKLHPRGFSIYLRIIANHKELCWRGQYWAALYRAGRHQEIVQEQKEFEKSLDVWCRPADYYFLAMTHHQLGNAAEAKRWLDRGRKEHDQGGFERDRLLEYQLLRREAETLLKASPGGSSK
jgi:tetratricopeptide (TPR) repeat protein